MNAWIDRKKNGNAGEDLVAKYFLERNFKILARNYRIPNSKQEIDLIVARNERAWIVEVKNHRWSGSGFESLISERQRNQLLRLTSFWHAKKLHSYQWGFCLFHVEQLKLTLLEKIEL